MESTSIKAAVTDPVTAAPAATAIPVLGDRAVAATDMLVLAPEIARVTGRAIRCVLWRRIHKDRIHTRSMTTAAAWVPAVVAGVVALGIVQEGGRRPALGRMTFIALHRRCQVILGFERRPATRTVAIVAAPDSAGIVHPGAASEGRRGMAEMTVRRRIQVRGNGGVLTDCADAIMAGFTVIDDAGVIEARRSECAGVVADAAVLACEQMAV